MLTKKKAKKIGKEEKSTTILQEHQYITL